MDYQFKPGDKAQVTRDINWKYFYARKGDEVEVIKVDNSSVPYFLRNKSGQEAWVIAEHIEPIQDEPKIVLTEWQRNWLESSGFTPKHINLIESILNEPPKYVPEKNSPVLVRDRDDSVLQPAIFSHIGDDGKYYTYIGLSLHGWKYCRPFDPAMIGKTDNP